MFDYYIEGEKWYFRIYTRWDYKQKTNILKHIKNDIVYFICMYLTKEKYQHKWFKYFNNEYYTKYYKKLVYVYGYGEE